MILGSVGLFFFAAPVFKGVLNIGNMAGMIVSLCLLLLGWNLRRVIAAFAKLWGMRPAGHVVTVMLLLIPIALITLAAVLSVCIAKGAATQPPDGATVIVLGCQVKGDRPSLALAERIHAAAEYLKANPAAVAILSGGQGPDERISEAVCMQRELTALGIEEGRLYLEDQSTTTRENIIFSEKIIGENGLNPDLAIVTNEFREYRASLIAKGEGIHSGSVPARTAWYLLPTYWTRELFGVLYELILVPKAT